MKNLLFLLPFLLFLGCNTTDTTPINEEVETVQTNPYIPIVRYQLVAGGSAVAPNSKIIMTFVKDVNSSTLTSYADLNYTNQHSVDVSYIFTDINFTELIQ